MNFFYWLIVIIPISIIIYIAFYSKRYVRDIADYLASGRVAGRYVLCVGDLSTQLSVLVLVGMCEQLYAHRLIRVQLITGVKAST